MSIPKKQRGGPMGTPSRINWTAVKFWGGYALLLIVIDGMLVYAWWPKK